MEKENLYRQLIKTIEDYPSIHKLLDNGFIRNQCKNGIASRLLKQVKENNIQHLSGIERKLNQIVSDSGYIRLNKVLKAARDFDSYFAFLSHIDAILLFRKYAILNEIEPPLPDSNRYSDIALLFNGSGIYCEVYSLSQPKKSKQYRSGTYTEEDDDTNVDKITRRLFKKINQQLLLDYPNILILSTAKTGDFEPTINRVMRRTFPQKPQVTLVMLCSLENSSKLGESPYWYLNEYSPYHNLGHKFLKHIQQEHKLIRLDD